MWLGVGCVGAGYRCVGFGVLATVGDSRWVCGCLEAVYMYVWGRGRERVCVRCVGDTVCGCACLKGQRMGNHLGNGGLGILCIAGAVAGSGCVRVWVCAWAWAWA